MNNSNNMFNMGLIYLIIIILKLIWKDDKEDKLTLVDSTIKTENHKQTSNYEYYVCGYIINERHDIFYLNFLGVDWKDKTITKEVILEGYNSTLSKHIDENQNNFYIKNNNVIPHIAKVAYNYLIDRSNYLGFEN